MRRTGRLAALRWLLVLIALAGALGLRPLLAGHAVAHAGHAGHAPHASPVAEHAQHPADHAPHHGFERHAADWAGHHQGDALCQALDHWFVAPAAAFAAALPSGVVPPRPPRVAANNWTVAHGDAIAPRARDPPV